MNLHRYPGLVDRLAGEYAVGVLRGGARRRLEALAVQDAAIRAAIVGWQARLGALPELVPPVAPPQRTWQAIERALGLTDTIHGPAGKANDSRMTSRTVTARERHQRWFESLAFWRGWSLAATGAALAAAIAFAVALRPLAPVVESTASSGAGEPVANGHAIERVAYVAALADVKTSKTMVFVMWDDKSAMMSAHRMSGGDAAPPGHSEQLWGIPEHGAPVSLGMLPPGKIVHMKVRGMNAYAKLAVSVEPPGGSPNASGPSGPVVCAGKLMATA
jgi:anti-sigma-K factor RskA